ncbi:MAG TPA: ABC transporter substrate-binding protein [Chloroflexota bacterium]|jgi:branched-chain amino acid transport system substrate-binding protein|nr:ABC transporter substrate-binding protein [Chloroflexota bacterium]
MGRWRTWAAVAGILALVAACAPPGAPGSGAGQQAAGPIKAGVLASLTGVSAASGQDMVNGWNLYWKLNGATVAGRQLQTLVEDDASEPNTGLTKARQFVEQQQVDFIVGPLLANIGYAVADYVKTTGTPTFFPIVAADDLTQRARVDNVIKVAGWGSSQVTHVQGDWAYDQGYRRVLTICADYAFGHEVCGGFVRAFTARGGQILTQLWFPLNTPDFGSYLAQIPGANPDAVFVLTVGADSVRFVKQWAEFGLKDRVPLLATETMLDQSVLRSMGPEAEGLISLGHWAEGRPARETQDMVDAYLREYNQLPSYYAAAMFAAAGWIAKAIERLNGNISDRKAFLDAVRRTEVSGPFGQQKLDDYGAPILNVYVRQVERRPDGRLWNVPIKTYENVSQFWTFGADKFLKQPLYSREFQGTPEQLRALGLQP